MSEKDASSDDYSQMKRIKELKHQKRGPATEISFDPLLVPAPGEQGLPLDAFEHPEDIIIETICGAIDESQPVEQYDGTLGVTGQFVDAHQAAVGQIQWNNNLAALYTNPGNVNNVRWCSGTLISNDLFLTAGHCFDPVSDPSGWMVPRDNNTNQLIGANEIATNQHVNFNFQVDQNGVLRPEQSFQILQLLEYRLGGLDYAIVRLGGNPGVTFGHTNISKLDANIGDMICIIGHPAGLPKRIEAGPVTDFHDTRIGYNDIDTLGGNSGSGILRSADGLIVGVHTNGGCDAQMIGHNHGQRISSLLSASPTLRQLSTDYPKTRAEVASPAFQNHAPNNYNYEVFVREFNSIRHHWLDYANGRWNIGSLIGTNVTGDPVAFQNHAPNNYNYEVFVQQGVSIRHHYFDYLGGTGWHEGALIGTNVASALAAFQNHAPNNYNYEVFFREGNNGLRHHYFDYLGGTGWHEGALIGTNVVGLPVAFQNHAPNNYNYEVFFREGNNGIRHYYFDYLGGTGWHEGYLISTNLTGDPIAFQNYAPNNYSFEVFFREGNGLRHHYFDYLGGTGWHEGALIGTNVVGLPVAFQNHAPNNYSYEVFVREGNNGIRHYYFDYLGGTGWHEGALQTGTNVASALAAFQNYAPNNYSYEVFVREGNGIRHYYFDYLGGTGWHQGALLG